MPPLLPRAARALEIHSTLGGLKRLGAADAVLRVYDATRADLELIAVAEEVVREASRDHRQEDGDAEC